MIDFGYVGELLGEIRDVFSDGLFWYKPQMIHMLSVTSLFFVTLYNINPFW